MTGAEVVCAYIFFVGLVGVYILMTSVIGDGYGWYLNVRCQHSSYMIFICLCIYYGSHMCKCV